MSEVFIGKKDGLFIVKLEFLFFNVHMQNRVTIFRFMLERERIYLYILFPRKEYCSRFKEAAINKIDQFLVVT